MTRASVDFQGFTKRDYETLSTKWHTVLCVCQHFPNILCGKGVESSHLRYGGADYTIEMDEWIYYPPSGGGDLMPESAILDRRDSWVWFVMIGTRVYKPHCPHVPGYEFTQAQLSAECGNGWVLGLQIREKIQELLKQVGVKIDDSLRCFFRARLIARKAKK